MHVKCANIHLRDAALTAFECARRSFGLTRSYAGKAGGGADAGAKSKRQGSSAGQIVGDATHEMLSFKEIYLFVGQPLLGFRLLIQLPLLPASGHGLKRFVLVSHAGHVAVQPMHVSRVADAPLLRSCCSQLGRQANLRALLHLEDCATIG